MQLGFAHYFVAFQESERYFVVNAGIFIYHVVYLIQKTRTKDGKTTSVVIQANITINTVDILTACYLLKIGCRH